MSDQREPTAKLYARDKQTKEIVTKTIKLKDGSVKEVWWEIMVEWPPRPDAKYPDPGYSVVKDASDHPFFKDPSKYYIEYRQAGKKATKSEAAGPTTFPGFDG